MKTENLLPIKMNALIFTYVTAAPFIISQNFVELTLLQITSISAAVVIIENLWSLRRGTPVIDERKQEILTDAMSWGYIAVTLSLIATLGTGVGINPGLIERTIGFGIWTFVLFLSLSLLYQNFGGGEE